MRNEYRITMEVSAYAPPAKDHMTNEQKTAMFRSILEREVELMLAGENCDHVFFDARVTIVPHDNDRDYTEDDARMHCGRTYLDAVREAFPGADLHTIERSVCPGRLFPNHPSGVKSGFLCPKGSKPNCRECWREEIPDSEEAQNHDD